MRQSPAYPQGIDKSHLSAKGWHRHANPASLIGIGLLLAIALAGVFGGQPHPTRTIQTPSATVTLQFPEILRNGEFFEMRATIKAKRPFKDVRLGISSTYWRDLTINTMIPGPSEEGSEGGQYRFSYGPLNKGESVKVKIDGQVNPPMFAGTQGELTVLDGDAVVVNIPVKLRVYP